MCYRYKKAVKRKHGGQEWYIGEASYWKEKGKVGNIKWNGIATMGGGPRGLIWKWAGPGDRPRAGHPALIRLCDPERSISKSYHKK